MIKCPEIWSSLKSLDIIHCRRSKADDFIIGNFQILTDYFINIFGNTFTVTILLGFYGSKRQSFTESTKLGITVLDQP